jgi:HSP20 family protein
MDIRRWDPFRDLTELQEGMDQMFDALRKRFSGGEQPVAASWTPPCDVYEDEGQIVVMMELPGIKMEDINLEVTADALTVHGERSWEAGENREWLRVERPYGKFSRSFSISVPVQVQDVKATYKDGVLTVTLPKSETVKPKKIDVQAG